jgi:hypothetical protein
MSEQAVQPQAFSVTDQDVFLEIGQLQVQNSVIKRQINALIQENQQLRSALQLATGPRPPVAPPVDVEVIDKPRKIKALKSQTAEV